MATEVKLPDMGEGITDVTISRWRVKAGDVVNAGDVIVEVATDKVDTEISAPSAGVILQTIGSEGEIVPPQPPSPSLAQQASRRHSLPLHLLSHRRQPLSQPPLQTTWT
jgi:pyruvate/2-oxoglutarate dehydrogenase complex dihydrolipoamide acyltransferase (E2) component